MFTQAVASPASSSVSKIVVAPRLRCRAFISTIESRSDCVMPARRIAPNEEPYSTRRRSSREYQTRCGMWWTSGCAPVAIELRQTGVSDGNVESARRYSPASASRASQGVRSGVTASSNVSARRPSITTRISFCANASVPGEDPEPGVAGARAGADPSREHQEDERLEVADDRHEREQRHHDRRCDEEDCEPAARPAAPERAARDRRRAEAAEEAADRARDRLARAPHAEADPDPRSER